MSKIFNTVYTGYTDAILAQKNSTGYAVHIKEFFSNMYGAHHQPLTTSCMFIVTVV